jgi:mono/diheme cytochrome c family protein
MFRVSNTSVFLTALVLSFTYVWTCNAAATSKGKSLFNENCAACHQADAIGKPGVAPSLISPQFLSIASDEFLFETISKGRTGTSMPAWGEELGKKKINAIIAFLRTHAKGPNRSQAVNSQRRSMGNAQLGKTWFDGICAKCHGIYGQGYAADGSGTAIGGPDFLRTASDGFIRETIMYGRDGTRMRPFHNSAALANLDKSEIDDVIKYMRTLRIPEDL